LLLPGTVLQTVSVKEVTDDAWPSGTPTATKWVLVKASQE
jgi:hypothetical protein